MDKTYGYERQQGTRRKRADDRRDDANIDDRLADGFDLISDEDPIDPPHCAGTEDDRQ